MIDTLAPARLCRYTERLELVHATTELVRAEKRSPAELADKLNARLAEKWPPPLNDEASRNCLEQRSLQPRHQAGWLAWYWIRQADRALIGVGGFKGGPDDQGVVELGYAILEPYQRCGFGTEAIAALVNWAFAQPEVSRVMAETLPELRASIRVLEKNAFVQVRESSNPGFIRFVRDKG